MAEYDAQRFRDFEHAGWEQAAPAYERQWRALTARTLPTLLDRAGAGPGTRLLEVACGPGEGIALAVARGAAAVGVDFSAAMLRLAAGRQPAPFLQSDAEGLPFREASFDAVVCAFGLLHFARPELALREMARVTRPSGRVAAAVWAGPEQMRVLGIVREAIAAAATQPDAAPPGPDFFQHADPDRFRSALEAAGLTDVSVEQLSFPHALPDVDALWRMVTEGGVRTAALVRAQPSESKEAIRQRVAEALEPYRDPSGNGYLVPAEAVVASGKR